MAHRDSIEFSSVSKYTGVPMAFKCSHCVQWTCESFQHFRALEGL